MQIIEPKIEVLDELNGQDILRKIELCGRVCYKSEERITCDSAEKFVRDIIKRGHESVLEHVSVSVRIICDRGVSHEIVRHRLCSISQESTRYVTYGGDIAFIRPWWLTDENTDRAMIWKWGVTNAAATYEHLLEQGLAPQAARAVLPNSLKTELIMTANLREWRHFFKLRTAPGAHPDMQIVANMILVKFRQRIPVIFDF